MALGRFAKHLVKFFCFVALALGLSILLFHFLMKPFQVYGSSMSPTLCDGDYLLVDRVWFRHSELRRGDLVVFKLSPGSRHMVKRVIAIGGDHIEAKGGKIFVNRSEQALIKASGALLAGESNWDIPPGYLFLMGDNPAHSQDSRYFGAVPSGAVYGRVILCYLPISHRRWLLDDGGSN